MNHDQEEERHLKNVLATLEVQGLEDARPNFGEPGSPCGEHMSREGTSTWEESGTFGSRQGPPPPSPSQLLQQNHPFTGTLHRGKAKQKEMFFYDEAALSTTLGAAGCRRFPIQFNPQQPTQSQDPSMLEACSRLRANAANTGLMYAQHGTEAQKLVHLTAQSAPGIAEVDSLAPTMELFIGQLPYHFDLISVVYMVNRVMLSIFLPSEEASPTSSLNIVTRIKQGPKPTCAFIEVVQPYAKILLRQSKRILCDHEGIWVATPQLDSQPETKDQPSLFTDLIRPLPAEAQSAQQDELPMLTSADVAHLEQTGFRHFKISPSAVRALEMVTQERSRCQVKGIPHQAVVMEPATVRGPRQQQLAHHRRTQQALQHQEMMRRQVDGQRYNTGSRESAPSSPFQVHSQQRQQMDGDRLLHSESYENLRLFGAENLAKVLQAHAPVPMSLCACGLSHEVAQLKASVLCVLCNRHLGTGTFVRNCARCEGQVVCPLCIYQSVVDRSKVQTKNYRPFSETAFTSTSGELWE